MAPIPLSSDAVEAVRRTTFGESEYLSQEIFREEVFLHPSPYTIHPTLLYPTLFYTLHPTLYTLHPTPFLHHPASPFTILLPTTPYFTLLHPTPLPYSTPLLHSPTPSHYSTPPHPARGGGGSTDDFRRERVLVAGDFPRRGVS